MATDADSMLVDDAFENKENVDEKENFADLKEKQENGDVHEETAEERRKRKKREKAKERKKRVKEQRRMATLEQEIPFGDTGGTELLLSTNVKFVVESENSVQSTQGSSFGGVEEAHDDVVNYELPKEPEQPNVIVEPENLSLQSTQRSSISDIEELQPDDLVESQVCQSPMDEPDLSVQSTQQSLVEELDALKHDDTNIELSIVAPETEAIVIDAGAELELNVAKIELPMDPQPPLVEMTFAQPQVAEERPSQPLVAGEPHWAQESWTSDIKRFVTESGLPKDVEPENLFAQPAEEDLNEELQFDGKWRLTLDGELAHDASPPHLAEPDITPIQSAQNLDALAGDWNDEIDYVWENEIIEPPASPMFDLINLEPATLTHAQLDELESGLSRLQEPELPVEPVVSDSPERVVSEVPCATTNARPQQHQQRHRMTFTYCITMLFRFIMRKVFG